MVWRTRPCTGSWLSRPPDPKHTHALCSECSSENGSAKMHLLCAQDTLFSHAFAPQHSTHKTPGLTLATDWANCALCLTTYIRSLPCGSTRALTLSNGQDQVPFFTEALVEFWRPEEAVPEGCKPSPSNSWLDSFLGRKLQAMGRVMDSLALMNLPSDSAQIPFLQKEIVSSN